MYKIALVEDDTELSLLISTLLKRYDYEVVVINDFENVLQKLIDLKADVILLDINLPYVDGFHICKQVRKVSIVPIIIISARNNDSDQILGMELGADDYVIKPLNVEVLHSKIKASIRRAYGTFTVEKSNVVFGNFSLDYRTFTVSNEGNKIELTKNEFKILKYLAEKPNELVTRESLLRELWDDISFIDNNTLNVNISRIKNKLKEIGIEEVIHTKRGYGYKFVRTGLEKVNE
ncbi:DNA-binding response regulator [Anaerobacillus alkalilacustris]|uniref:DNA-binding response regulator n=1 Tax=Anaerobacillus alkalilacustris TaxID=393763 RepID=A0A1S2LYP2_9BACI|nr:response regulator transcription factor [Anaerobacillus alkalilacustris]OIJ17609.1 DNA-binding response regulator [Anaerobacillus alkalilacustris]